ncbi:MAG: methyl-accepting chemotaxis protein [Desulfobacteraceae bacterium]|jgi:methyl-accepting chemotaxis protein
MKLKHKLVISTATILFCCIGGYVTLETIIQQTRDQVNNKIICDIYDDVRKANEQFHTQLTGKRIQKLTLLNEMVEITTGGRTPQNVAVVKGLYLTLEEKANLSRMVVLDRQLNVLINESNQNALAIPSGFLQSKLIRDLCNKAAETWDNQGSMVCLDGIPAFAVASVVIDDNDNASGFVIGFVPVKFLAETLADRLDAHISFETNMHKLFTGTNESILSVLAKKGPETIKALNSAVVKTKNSAFLTHAIPVFPDAPKGNTGRYLVSKDFTAGYALIEKLKIGRVVILALVIAASIATACVLLGRLLRPLFQVKKILHEISQGAGDLTRRIDIKTKDEVGDLAGAFNIFAENIRTIITEISSNAILLERSSMKLSGISENMSTSAAKTSAKADGVSTASQEMSDNMINVAAAMEQASTNTTIIASASEQMSATISEISQNTAKAKEIANDATRRSQEASEKIGLLSHVANSIGKITETITEISAQTNMLALNATIESARAGEAGKGFVVVANEIKELAKQTAEATLNIKKQIEEVQSTTEVSVTEIIHIKKVISDVNDIVGIIASSVEEQSSAIQEIAGNIAQTSVGIQEVNLRVNQSSNASDLISRNIYEVNHAAGEIAAGTQNVNLSAEDMNQMAANLNTIVQRFRI